MSFTMRTYVKSKLDRLRADYARVRGEPFTYFYCPILFKDENVRLCQAHIINQAFSDTTRDWTVQRSDVDSFYGSRFEADFVAIQYNENGSIGKVLTDQTLSKRFRPSILVDDEAVEYFVATDDVPDCFPLIEYQHSGSSVQLGIKIPSENLVIGEHKFEIAINKDVRIAALVSLVKAAHLTLFHILGYRYVLSASGYFVGRQILGEFFYQNYNKSKAKVLENAFSSFREFTHMVRPVLSTDFNLRGTITDSKFFICKGNGCTPWALIVFIRTAQSLHAVMIPIFDQPDAVATFLGFLQNENNLIEGSLGCYRDGHWEISKELSKLVWPKTGVLYPEQVG